jgi:GrpB-like predicted nucleotidyltransferase (UPF0157 family)
MIVVVEYDPAWPQRFEQLRQEYGGALAAAGVPVVAIEHVGSTSVPGLAAKPVIDCDIVVAAPDVAAASQTLTGLGFKVLGELGIPQRWAFKEPGRLAGTNTYVVVAGSLALRNHLAVRDILRTDPDLRMRYADVKRRVGATAANIDEYGRGKNAMIQQILAAAGLTDEERASIDANQVPSHDDVPRLADPGPQELPGLPGGLRGLGSASHDRVDVGQPLADLQGDVDPGVGGGRGQPLRIAEQQVGRAHLDQQRRQPGQRREQRRGQGRLRVSPGQVIGGELAEQGGGGERVLVDPLGHRGPRAGQVHRRGHQHRGRGERVPGVPDSHEQGDREPSAGRGAGHRDRPRAQALAGAEPAPCGPHVVDGGGEGMLGGQAVLGEEHPHPAGPSQPGGQLAVLRSDPSS